jgi:hypothetical protein
MFNYLINWQIFIFIYICLFIYSFIQSVSQSVVYLYSTRLLQSTDLLNVYSPTIHSPILNHSHSYYAIVMCSLQ